MFAKTPYQKIITGIQKEYAENNSIEIIISKAEFDQLVYVYVGSVIPSRNMARDLLIDKNLIIYNRKANKVVIHLSEIKKQV